MTNKLYSNGLVQMGKGSVAWEADTIKVMMVTTDQSFNDAHTVYADISANEVTPSSGYTAGGSTLANCTVNSDTGEAEFDCDNVTWTSIDDAQAGAAVVYKSGGALMAWIDTATGATFPVTFNGGDYTITWNAEGIFKLASP